MVKNRIIKKLLLIILTILLCYVSIIFYVLYGKAKEFSFISHSSQKAKEHNSLVKIIDKYSTKCTNDNIIREIWVEKFHRRRNLFSSEFVYDSLYSIEIKLEDKIKDSIMKDGKIYSFIKSDSINTNEYIGRDHNGFYNYFYEKKYLNKEIDTIVIKSENSCLEIIIPIN